ncbi:MAG: DUF4263 domain-containing protein [Acidobacteria bacterium]|nr:DUF4263 domain-containing protein [Acidobacteriota bacterium]
MGDTTDSPMQAAQSLLAAEIARLGLREVEISGYDESWLSILLREEDRTVWLGYREGEGYFITWDQEAAATHFFSLNQAGITEVLSVLSSKVVSSAVGAEAEVAVRDLLDSIASPEPDPEKIRDILEETPTSAEGIDVLATIAALKTFRSAIEELRGLLASQEKKKHKESVYQELFRRHPWMLGSQYGNVLWNEPKLRLDARADLMLASSLGYADIVELKRPDTPLLVKSKLIEVWRPSVSLSDAFAQARKYLRSIDEHRWEISSRLNFRKQSVSRMYRSSVILVAGRTPVAEGELDALRDLSLENSRILLLTYDDVLAISESTIQIFERRLTARAPGQLSEPGATT